MISKTGMKFLLHATFILITGCGDDLPPSSRISTTRILGAQINVQADSTRASPRPEESFELEWFVAAAQEPPPLTWAFIACVPANNLTGTSFCANESISQVFMGSATNEAPRMVFQVPPVADLLDARGLLVVGIFCGRGLPVFNAEAFVEGCSEGTLFDQAMVSLMVPIQRADTFTNHNPDLSNNKIYLDEQAWPGVALPTRRDNCVHWTDVPEIPALVWSEDNVPVRFALDEGDRETFVKPATEFTEEETLPEEMLLSHFTTAGKMERQFSVIESKEPERTEMLVDWILPEKELIAAEGQVVRFFFVLRDGRSGVDWTERFACLLPAASE